jgi:hypothetical protein
MRLALALALLSSFAAVAQQRLEITIEKRESGAWKIMDPSHVFQDGDQLRFRFKSNQAGFLYVVNEGTSGEQSTLFPSEQSGTENKIEPGREYLIPSTSGAFRVTGPQGYDTVYWVLSPVRIGEPAKYRPLPPPPEPGKVPVNLIPRCDDTVFRARGECIDAGAGLKPNLVPGLKPRELFFVRKGDQSIVSVPPIRNVGSAPVTYQFRIAHH